MAGTPRSLSHLSQGLEASVLRKLLLLTSIHPSLFFTPPPSGLNAGESKRSPSTMLTPASVHSLSLFPFLLVLFPGSVQSEMGHPVWQQAPYQFRV